MRDLNATNPAEAKPASLAGRGAVLSVTFGAIGVALADGAAPKLPFSENPILIFCALLLGAGAVMLVVPRLFSWGWETKYFGVSLLHVGSLSLVCLVPCFCLLLYGRPPAVVRVTAFVVLIGIHVAWATRFMSVYHGISEDPEELAMLYEEEPDAVYYMQRNDKYLLDKRHKFRQVPQNRYFALCLLFAFLIAPWPVVRTSVGLSFMHVLGLIGALPVSLMGIGFATRALLVFYVYPSKIMKRTGKRVYVDMSAPPRRSRVGATTS